MASAARSREYLTIRRNASRIIRCLATDINPATFAQSLHDIGLITRDVLEKACIREVTASDRIQPVIFAIETQVDLDPSKYYLFMDVLQREDPLLAETVRKYFATDLELNIAQMLSTVADWEELGHQIDYDPIKLSRLQTSGLSPERCREEMVSDWARQKDSSWMKLARALDRMKETRLADTIRRRFQPLMEYFDDSLPQASRGEVLLEAQKQDLDLPQEIEEFESKFRDLAFQIQSEIEDKEIELENTSKRYRLLRRLQHTLTCLPATMKAEHYEYMERNLTTISKADSIHTIFNHLNLYWSFLDYTLLGYLIKELGSKDLKAQLKEYVTDLEKFRKTTTVTQFAKFWPKTGDKRTPPPNFTEVIAKLPIDASSCTLEYVERLRNELCRECSLCKSILLVAEIKPGSVIVVWYLPDSVAMCVDINLSLHRGTLYDHFSLRCSEPLVTFDDLHLKLSDVSEQNIGSSKQGVSQLYTNGTKDAQTDSEDEGFECESFVGTPNGQISEFFQATREHSDQTGNPALLDNTQTETSEQVPLLKLPSSPHGPDSGYTSLVSSARDTPDILSKVVQDNLELFIANTDLDLCMPHLAYRERLEADITDIAGLILNDQASDQKNRVFYTDLLPTADRTVHSLLHQRLRATHMKHSGHAKLVKLLDEAEESFLSTQLNTL